jgi:hypothetical protein
MAALAARLAEPHFANNKILGSRDDPSQHQHVFAGRLRQAPGCCAGQDPHGRVSCESIALPRPLQLTAVANPWQLIDNDPYAPLYHIQHTRILTLDEDTLNESCGIPALRTGLTVPRSEP